MGSGEAREDGAIYVLWKEGGASLLGICSWLARRYGAHPSGTTCRRSLGAPYLETASAAGVAVHNLKYQVRR